MYTGRGGHRTYFVDESNTWGGDTAQHRKMVGGTPHRNKAFVGLGSCDNVQTETSIFKYAN